MLQNLINVLISENETCCPGCELKAKAADWMVLLYKSTLAKWGLELPEDAECIIREDICDFVEGWWEVIYDEIRPTPETDNVNLN